MHVLGPPSARIRAPGFGWASQVGTIWQDVRYAARLLRRSPGFAAGAIATLGLGIGGTTAIFSVVDALFLRPPTGVTDAASVRRLYIKRDSGTIRTPAGGPGMWNDYVTMRDGAPALERIGAYMASETIDMGRGPSAEQVRACVVSGDFLGMLGVRPALGRLFVAEEDRPSGGYPVALISHEMWRTRFGGTQGVLGRTLLLNGRPVEVVGVAQKGFTGIDADAVDLWLPSSMAEAVGIAGGQNWRATLLGVRYVVRLPSKIDEQTAATQAAKALGGAVEPGLDPTPEVLLAPLVTAAVPGGTRAGNLSLWLVLVAALVLVVACANVANLLLARAITRRRELAVRLSLGAGAWRIARQHLTESALLALLGGATGVLLAYWTTGMVRQFPLASGAGGMDGRLLIFALGVSLVTGLLFGTLPALRAVRTDPVRGLRDARDVGGASRGWARRALVVLQVAVSFILLAGAALFVSSLRQVNAIHSGVDLDRLLVATVDFRRAGYTPQAREDFFALAVSRLRTLPGVERASVVHFAPLSGLGFPVRWSVPGREAHMDKAGFLNLAGPEYFQTAGTRLLKGRGIEAADVATGEPVAVVNDAMARLMADDGNVVGTCMPIARQVRRGGCTRIVGVVETQRNRYLDEGAVPMIFRARAQAAEAIPYGTPVLLVRTSGHPRDHQASVRSVLQGLRGDLPYVAVQPLTHNIRKDVLPFRLGATLFSMFGVVALALAAVGLYGVLGYFVTERTAEIGMRRALGAPATGVVALVVRQGLTPVGAGLLIGLAAALAGTRYVRSLLFGIEAHDPASFAGAAGFLLVVALVAVLLPAWRAARIDPIAALRRD